MKNIFRSGNPITAVIIVVSVFISLPENPLLGQVSVKHVKSIAIDRNNCKWFSTDDGLVSFDGVNWKLYQDNPGMPSQDLKSIACLDMPEGPELWIASPQGATVSKLPLEDRPEVITYNPGNSPILSKEVLGIAAGTKTIRWFGTDKGVSALSNDKWLNPDYDGFYTDRMFMEYPITSMATNPGGDSLYAGTEGVGVLRVYRDELDGISGASVYAQWGPIDLPSDYILSIYVAPDGTKWFGTEEGVARHYGNNTLDHWTAFTTDDGLVDNFVQAICGDKEGKIWFGTPAGISVFTGSSWVSYTTDNGLASNNILSIATDHDGIVWIGTDAGITSYQNEEFINY
jgi:ligand-binding sensor domain-containing protein